MQARRRMSCDCGGLVQPRVLRWRCGLHPCRQHSWYRSAVYTLSSKPLLLQLRLPQAERSAAA